VAELPTASLPTERDVMRLVSDGLSNASPHETDQTDATAPDVTVRGPETSTTILSQHAATSAARTTRTFSTRTVTS
jgi:hypothetical protein